MSAAALLESSVEGIPVRRGKVRDIYDFGDRLLFVASDRISAFDWVLPTGTRPAHHRASPRKSSRELETSTSRRSNCWWESPFPGSSPDPFAICNPVDGSHNGCVGIGKQADRAG